MPIVSPSKRLPTYHRLRIFEVANSNTVPTVPNRPGDPLTEESTSLLLSEYGLRFLKSGNYSLDKLVDSYSPSFKRRAPGVSPILATVFPFSWEDAIVFG